MAKQPPPKSRPERDPMDVGLDRNRSRKRSSRNLPPVVEEYGGWFAAAVVIALFLVPFKLFGCFDSPPPQQQPTAQLRVSSGPLKTWAEGSATELQSVSVEVENRGPQAAQGVAVAIQVRSTSFTLSGPQALQPGQRAFYNGSTKLNVTSEDVLGVQLSCANCPALAPAASAAGGQ